MAKGASKSSASSATRKKYARKAAKDGSPTDTPNLPKEKKAKGKDKAKSKEPPRKKMYIPPVKPQPVQQDPIDALGLAQRLPAELLVVWRGLSKKDAVTKGKALEELRAVWIDRVHLLLSNNDDDDAHRDADAEAHMRLERHSFSSLPVWVRCVPSAMLASMLKLTFILIGFWQRCIMCLRSSFIQFPPPAYTLALTAHADILRAKPLRTQMFFFLREIASAEQVESILGSWCMATRDQDRHVAPVAQSSWDTHVSFVPADAEAAADASSLDRTVEKEGEDEKLVLDGTQMAALLVFVQRALLDPLALHANLNPVQVPVDVSVPKTVRGKPVPTVSAAVQTRRTDSEPMARAKGESEEENETDRKARLRIGALGALQWILGTYTVSSIIRLRGPAFSQAIC